MSVRGRVRVFVWSKNNCWAFFVLLGPHCFHTCVTDLQMEDANKNPLWLLLITDIPCNISTYKNVSLTCPYGLNIYTITLLPVSPSIPWSSALTYPGEVAHTPPFPFHLEAPTLMTRTQGREGPRRHAHVTVREKKKTAYRWVCLLRSLRSTGGEKTEEGGRAETGWHMKRLDRVLNNQPLHRKETRP